MVNASPHRFNDTLHPARYETDTGPSRAQQLREHELPLIGDFKCAHPWQLLEVLVVLVLIVNQVEVQVIVHVLFWHLVEQDHGLGSVRSDSSLDYSSVSLLLS